MAEREGFNQPRMRETRMNTGVYSISSVFSVF